MKLHAGCLGLSPALFACVTLSATRTAAATPGASDDAAMNHAAAASSSAAPLDTGFSFTARAGTQTTSASTGTTLLGPALGVGVERFFHRNLGIAVHYDAGISSRGTAAVDLTRITQQLVLTVDARVRVHPAASLRAGIGGGGSWLLVTTAVGQSFQVSGTLAPAAAWRASLDVDVLPKLRLAFGVTGLIHERGHDALYFGGVAIPF